MNDWNELFAFADDKERIEHEADVISLLIAQEIKRTIKQKSLSSKDFARIIGTSPAYVTQVFRGDKKVNMVFLAKVVQKLGVKINIEIKSEKEEEPSLDEVLDYRSSIPPQPCQVFDFDSISQLQKVEGE